ncbi:MAG: alpha-E domain-containing protein [Pseudomonadota bacterium]
MLLGKSAGGLYWMFRYLERAEHMSRMVGAAWRLSLTRSSDMSSEWKSIIASAGLTQDFEERFQTYEFETVVNYILRMRDSDASIMCCITNARNNARLVRTSLSTEVWEAVNDGYLRLKAELSRPVTLKNLQRILTEIRQSATLVRGAFFGSMLRNDIYDFARIGTFVERADNTARLLDVKYFVLLPSVSYVGSRLDNAQWEVILRSLSAYRAYGWVNEGNPTAAGIARFLILDSRLPRSLKFCYKQMLSHLSLIEEQYEAHRESHGMAARIYSDLKASDVEHIFEHGLHEFLTEFISDTAALSRQIETDYRFGL